MNFYTIVALALQCISLATAIILVVIGSIEIVTLEFISSIRLDNFYKVFTPFFLILFSVMIVCSEFRIRFVLEYFTFLNHFLGRGIYCLFLASMVAQQMEDTDKEIDTRTLISIVFGISLFCIGVFYVLLYLLSIWSDKVRNLRDNILHAQDNSFLAQNKYNKQGEGDYVAAD